MKVIVCVKQVPDTSGKVAVNPDGTLNLAKIALCAVETVLRNTSPDAEDYPPAS